MSGVPYTLLNAVATGTSESLAVPPSFQQHSILISASSGVTSGAVQIETSNTVDDALTWAQVGGGPISVVAATDIIYNFAGVFRFIRARISTTIAGGATPTATVVYNGAKSY